MQQTVPAHPLATSSAPICPGPIEKMVKPSWTVPANACDSHAHVIGDGVTYPFTPKRSYTAPEATEAQYLAMLDGLGLDRGVLVQPSIHGTDNRLMVDVLNRHRARLRGVAVCASDVTDAELRELHDAGVRGLRINVALSGGVGFDAMDSLASRIGPMGWHLQFLINPPRLLEGAAAISKIRIPIVIDHIAAIHHTGGASHPAFAALLSLVKDGNTWVKLSAAYRRTADVAGYSGTSEMPQALLAAAPDRMVWGSDWPHATYFKPMIATGPLLELLGRWAPDETLRRKVLVDNPAVLYGF